MVRSVCKVDDCDLFVKSQGYCSKHYERFVRMPNETPEQKSKRLKGNKERQNKRRRANPELVNEQNRKRQQKGRMILEAIKVTAGCIDCGYDENPVALDFDHRDPSLKSIEVSKLTNCSRERLFEEAMKCDVRCAICHRIKTNFKENIWEPCSMSVS